MSTEAPDVGTQLGQQPTDNSCQDVAAPRRGDPGRALSLAVEVLEGRGYEGRGALEQHRGFGQTRSLPHRTEGGCFYGGAVQRNPEALKQC